MEIKKSKLYIGVALLILVAIGFFFFKGGNPTTSGNVVQSGQVIQGETQKVVISMKNSNYYPQEVRVKAGKPVEISLDSSVTGCFRSFNMKQLNIKKVMNSPQDTLTFTPSEKGMYTFTCGMGMGTGTLVVE